MSDDDVTARKLSPDEISFIRRSGRRPGDPYKHHVRDLLVVLALIGVVVVVGLVVRQASDERPERNLPTATTSPARVEEAFDYCRSNGYEVVASRLDMPPDDLSDIAFEYSLKIYKATSGDKAVAAAMSCMDGFVAASGLANWVPVTRTEIRPRRR